jgi:transcriptional regulator with XRE-family HTH domain
MITKKSKDSSAAEFFHAKRGAALSFGAALAAMRQVEGLSQFVYAKKLGISTAHLCDLEKGRRFVTAERAAKFAKKMGHPPSYWVKRAIQDQIDQAGLRLRVEVFAA